MSPLQKPPRSPRMSPIYPLLGLLRRGAQYGYELKRVVDDEFAPYWRIDFAQLYRSLHKMMHSGWIQAQVEPGVNGPARKVYALTPRGHVAFEAWMRQAAKTHDEFWVKMRLAQESGLNPQSLLAAERARIEDERAAWADAQRHARAADDPGRLLLTEAARRATEAAHASLEFAQALTRPARTTAWSGETPPLIAASDDPLLRRLAEMAHLPIRVVGSLGGLLALAQHEAQVAGAHLRDVESDEYNIPFVQHLLGEEDVLLIHFARREFGLLVAPGNPKGLWTWRDLTRRGVRFINRARGTGTRAWLMAQLRAARLEPTALRDWERTAPTYDAIAAAIATQVADVGPGLRATAVEWGLDFIPLGQERYDLVIPQSWYASPQGRDLLDKLHDRTFRRRAESLPGYDLALMGRVLARVRYARVCRRR